MRRADHSSRGVLPIVQCPTGCDHEFSKMRRPWPTGGCCAMVKKKIHVVFFSATYNEYKSYKKYIHNFSRTAEVKRMHNSPRRVFKDYVNTRVNSVNIRIEYKWFGNLVNVVNLACLRFA